MRIAVFLLAMSSLLFSCARSTEDQVSLDDLRWVDLTHAFDSSTLYWPNNPSGFGLHPQSVGITPNGYYYSSYTYSAPEHGGTHLDAPVHFSEGKLSSDQIPLRQLTGRAVVIDVSEQATRNRDYQISAEDLQSWEKINGAIPDSAILLFRTGYGKFYPDRAAYFGTDVRGPEAIPQLHFPGISPQAAEWLVSNRTVRAVGLDTPSLDYGQSKDFLTHRTLMERNIVGFENLANLDQLPVKGAFVVALPMKIVGGSGGPLRIMAGLN